MKLTYGSTIILNTHKLSEDEWFEILRDQYNLSKKLDEEYFIHIGKDYYIRISYDEYCKIGKRNTYLDLPNNTYLLDKRTMEDIIEILYLEDFII